MTKQWVIVANSSDARVFETNLVLSQLRFIKEFKNPNGRLKEKNIDSDRHGMRNNGRQPGHNSMSSTVSTNEHEQIVFAKELADFLKKKASTGSFDSLTLVSPAQFLGKLRDSFSPQLRKLVSRGLVKDLPSSWIDNRELMQRLQEDLRS